MAAKNPRRAALRHVVIVGGCALALGCAKGNSDIRRERTPVSDFGVGATVIMPGQQLPMPGPNGSGPSAGNVTWVGGARSQGSSQRMQSSEPLGEAMKKSAEKAAGPVAGAAVGAPVAAAGALANKAGEHIRQRSSSTPGTSTAQGTADPAGTPTAQPAPPPAPLDPHHAAETARIDELERELTRRQGNVAPPIPLPIPVPPQVGETGTQHASVAPTGRSFSIADELAMLQAKIPPKTRPEDLAGVRAESHEPAPRAGGVADQVSDRNGDGRPDHWVYRHAGQKVRELFDEDGDSAPDRTIYYDPRTGLEQSQEEDANLDGRLDTWVEYRDGKIARQRRDTDHDGFLDTWTFYRDGQITREEQDLNGDGFRNRMAFYEQGRLVREREDQDGDGRVDRVTLYDGSERIVQRDEDQDGDGLIDTRSYYENGRLARRELLEKALQESVDRETLSQPAWDAGPQEES